MAMDCGTEIEGGQERSGTSTIDVSNEDASSAAESCELSIDQIQYESEFQAAGQEDDREQHDDYSDSGTDKDMPTIVRRQRNDATSDNSSSNGLYTYHTDNNNSSIEDTKDNSTTVLGLQERCRDNSSSNDDSRPCQEETVYTHTATQIPNSIDTRPIILLWMYDGMEDDEYDADHKDDILTPKLGMVEPI